MKYAINVPKNYHARLIRYSLKIDIDTLFTDVHPNSIIIICIGENKISFLSLSSQYHRNDIIKEISWTSCKTLLIYTKNPILKENIEDSLKDYKTKLTMVSNLCEPSCTGISISLKDTENNSNELVNIFKNKELPSLLLAHPLAPSQSTQPTQHNCIFDGYTWSIKKNTYSNKQNLCSAGREHGLTLLFNATTLAEQHAFHAASDHALNAIKQLTRYTIKSDPKLAESYYFYGMSLFHAGEINEARNALQICIDLQVRVNKSTNSSSLVKNARTLLTLCQQTLLFSNNDILGEIFKFLEQKDILAGMITCKKFYQGIPNSLAVKNKFYNQLSFYGKIFFKQQNNTSFSFFGTNRHYRLPPFRYPKELYDLIRLISTTRRKQLQWHDYDCGPAAALAMIRAFNNIQLLIEKKTISLNLLTKLFDEFTSPQNTIFYNRLVYLLNLLFSVHQMDDTFLTQKIVELFLRADHFNIRPLDRQLINNESDPEENNMDITFKEKIKEILMEIISNTTLKNRIEDIYIIHRLAGLHISTHIITRNLGILNNENYKRLDIALKAIYKFQDLSYKMIWFSDDLAELFLSKISLTETELMVYVEKLSSILNTFMFHKLASPPDLLKRTLFLLKNIEFKEIEEFIKEINLYFTKPNQNLSDYDKYQYANDQLTKVEINYVNAHSSKQPDPTHLNEAEELYAYFSGELSFS